MKRSFTGMFFSALLVLLLVAPVTAQDKKMYSWTDENGTVHFSDSQPSGQQATEQVIPASDSSPGTSPYADTNSGPSAAELRRQEIAQNREEKQVKDAMNSAQCSAWKAEVDRLEPNRRVFYTNDQGETERMDDVVRTDRVAELKSLIGKNCK